MATAPGITLHLTCPVCGETFDVIMRTAETWGTVSLRSPALAEVTLVDDGTVSAHMLGHMTDGSHREALRKHLEATVVSDQSILDHINSSPGPGQEELLT